MQTVDLVIADTAVLATLPQRELSAGIAEVIKYGLLGDAPFYRWLQAQVDWSRVYMAGHVPSDLTAGALLGDSDVPPIHLEPVEIPAPRRVVADPVPAESTAEPPPLPGPHAARMVSRSGTRSASCAGGRRRSASRRA